MNPITSIASLSGDLLIAVIAGLVFIEETGIPVPFAPGDLLLIIAGIAIASDTVEPVPMVAALLAATVSARPRWRASARCLASPLPRA